MGEPDFDLVSPISLAEGEEDMGKKRKPGGTLPLIFGGLSAKYTLLITFFIFIAVVVSFAPKVLAKEKRVGQAVKAHSGEIHHEVIAQAFAFERRWPITGEVSQKYSRRHPGIDIRSNVGKSIYSFGKGEVKYVGWRYGYGKAVIVKHDNGYSSLYAHLAQIKVKEGDHIEQSTELATVGLTGWTSGPHLHLEIYEDGKSIDPYSILPETENATLAKF